HPLSSFVCFLVYLSAIFFPVIPRPPMSPLFPYTTLFRSGGGMRVAADNGHPRQGDALFRPHYVDDPLIRVIQVIQFDAKFFAVLDRKSTRLNSSHVSISYAVFCLKKKKHVNMNDQQRTRS